MNSISVATCIAAVRLLFNERYTSFATEHGFNSGDILAAEETQSLRTSLMEQFRAEHVFVL